jgi:glycogen operon protein
LHRFLKLLIERRLLRDVEYERRRVSLNQFLRETEHAWHGVKLNHPDWGPDSHSLAFCASLKAQRLHLHLILNAYWNVLDFQLPVVMNGSDTWRRWVDTALDSPNEIVEWSAAPPVRDRTYPAGARSVVVLIAGEGFMDTGSPPLRGYCG